MIFQRISPKLDLEEEVVAINEGKMGQRTAEVETVVGPSVQVEGEFASEGNIIVKGIVRGSIHTTKHLLVEGGAKVVAHIQVGTASISGEVRGNIKASERVDIGSAARIVGDIETQILTIEAGAILVGKVSMPGVEGVAEESLLHTSSKVDSNKSQKN